MFPYKVNFKDVFFHIKENVWNYIFHINSNFQYGAWRTEVFLPFNIALIHLDYTYTFIDYVKLLCMENRSIFTNKVKLL